MKIIITYKSKTGFAKKYAEMIAKETGCRALPLKEMTVEKMSEFDMVIFGGGIYAGNINGFKTAKNMFEKSTAKEFVVFSTGGMPNEAAKETIKEIWTRNLGEELESIPHFYMQGGICYEKMSFPSKTLMKMFATMLEKKEDKTEEEKGFAQHIKQSYDIVDKKYAEPLIKLIYGGQ